MLVPIIRAQTATPVLQVADALSASTRSSGLVLGLVEVPRRRVPNLAAAVEARRLDLLRWIASVDSVGRQTRLTVQMRVSHDVGLGIREAVYENQSNLIVVEWPGLTSRRPRLLGAVIEDLVTDPPAELVLVRPDPAAKEPRLEPRGILAPVRGGRNAELAVRVAAAIAESWQTKLTVLHVLEAAHHPRRRAAEAERFRRLVAEIRYRDIEVLERSSVTAATTILQESMAYRTVVLGAFANPPRSPVLVRSDLAGMVRQLRGTVILVRAA